MGIRSSAPRDQVRAAALEDVAAGVAESDRGHQRLIEVALLLVEGARGGHRVLQAVEQVRRRVGVHVGQVGEQLDVAADLRHLRVDLGQDLVAVDDRLPEPVA